MTIAFNARYLLEALQNMDDDQLAIEIAGPLSPGVLKPVDDPVVRPRDHAGAHAILSGRSAAPVADRGRPGGPADDAPATRATPTMPVRSLTLAGFRSYDALELDLAPGAQVVVGPNAAGKTNLIEALVVLSRGRSHRGANEAELIRWGHDFARVEAGVDPDSAGVERTREPRHRVEVVLHQPGSATGSRKRVRINGVPRRPGAHGSRAPDGRLRTRGHAADQRRSRAPARLPRRARGPARADRGRGDVDVRPGPHAAQLAPAADPRGGRRSRRARATGTASSATAAASFGRGAARRSTALAAPLAAAHAEIAPGERRSRCAT